MVRGEGRSSRRISVDLPNQLIDRFDALKRTRVGDYLISDSLSIDELQNKWKSIHH